MRLAKVFHLMGEVWPDLLGVFGGLVAEGLSGVMILVLADSGGGWTEEKRG